MGRVEANFQDTEIGLMPEDWKITSFADIADKKIIRSIAGGPFGSNLKNSDYTSDGVRIIQLQNIGDGNFIDDYKIYTSEKKAKELINYHIFPKEIILSKMGDPVARACIIPDIEEKYIMSSDGIRLVVDEEDFDKKFIFFYINSEYFRKRAFAVSMGSTRLRIGLPQLKKLKILKPSTKDEQTAIANTLSDADGYIESLEKLISKKQKIKQGAMQQLLKPKPHWELKKLGEVAEIYQPQTISQNSFVADGYLVYGANGIVGFYDKYNHKTWQTAITCRGSTCGVVNKTVDKCWITGNAMVVNVDKNDEIDKLFFYFVISKQDFIKCITGSGQPQIVREPIREFEIYIPKDKEEQKLIAKTLSDMDSEITALTQKLTKAKAIKQGMMQQLLTGKIRLV